MELAESIESINRQLQDLFGTDTVSGKPMWRVVWSEDQLEKRLTHYSKEGIHLAFPQIIELPKYRQWIQHKHILERLVLVPELHQELTVEKISYEPIHVFEGKDKQGNPIALPPKVNACKMVIDTLYAAMGKKSLAKYKDPGESLEMKNERINNLQQELFGNETETGDALAHGEAIVVPRNYSSEKKVTLN